MSSKTLPELPVEIWLKIFRSYEHALLRANPWKVMELIRSRKKDPVAFDRGCKDINCASFISAVRRRGGLCNRVDTIIIDECEWESTDSQGPDSKESSVIETAQFNDYISALGVLSTQLVRISTTTNVHITINNKASEFPALTHYQVTKSRYGDDHDMSYGKIPPVKNISMSGSDGVGFATMGEGKERWDGVTRFEIRDYDYSIGWSFLRPLLSRMTALVAFSLRFAEDLDAQPRFEDLIQILKGLPISCESITFLHCETQSSRENLLPEWQNGKSPRSENNLQKMLDRFEHLEYFYAPADLIPGAACSGPTFKSSLFALKNTTTFNKIIKQDGKTFQNS
ncbi:hypothetical protein TWF481_010399 [Arthrobotrys musiformis]|uniref:F-box domain-containing protein n=1 Tax=Arthrobotrys musiformis TaxID=47236 RepID=A0AAV9W0U7_9PEZI